MGMDLGTVSWNYQACTELLLEPITSEGLGFYPPAPGKQTAEVFGRCAMLFGVSPRPFWMPASFGRGKDYALSLADGGGALSRVVFVENSKDPWHVGTATLGNGTMPPTSSSSSSVSVSSSSSSSSSSSPSPSSSAPDLSTPVRYLAQGGAHHQDLRFSSPYDAPDVQAARRLSREAIEGWLEQRHRSRRRWRQ